MAGADRQAADPVALQQELAARPQGFELFEALRRIECAFPQKARLGRSAKPSEDPVRLRHTPTLAFVPRSVDRFEPGTAERPPRLYSYELGLFGPQAPLPLHLTEYALDRQRNARDDTFAAFADIFHHRLLSLFYRAWADAQPTVQMDRPHEDRFRHYVGALVGMASPGLDGRDALPDGFRRFFAGRLLPQSRNAEGLRRLVEYFFRVPVRLREFMPEWMPLPADAHLRLGGSAAVASLGRTTVLGGRVWGAQQRFRLRMGPLTRSQFHHLLPGGEALQRLVAAVRAYVGEEKGWDVQLVLRRDQVPGVQLGRSGRLGLSSWVGRRRDDRDADEVVLRPGD